MGNSQRLRQRTATKCWGYVLHTAALSMTCLVLSLSAGAAAQNAGSPTGHKDYTIHSFRKIQLSDKFWAEGVAIADVNLDGHMDIISGPYWYEGPDFKTRHEIFPATQTFVRKKNDGTEERIEGYEGAWGKNNAYSNIQVASIWDFNGDGWPDVLTIGFPGTEAVWYENPGPEGLAENKPWARHVVFDVVGDESPTFVDLFKNGHPVLLCMSGEFIGYVTPDWSHPEKKWTFHAISGRLPMLRELNEKFGPVSGGKSWPYAHGLGYGDINGDGRLDVLGPEGWWEQPRSISGNPLWKFHKWPFLRKRPEVAKIGTLSEGVIKFYEWPYTLGGAQIYVYDVNGDGLPDIVSSLDAHGYGLAWFEQLPKRSASGEIQFKPHIFMGRKPSDNRYGVEFTQLHAVELADIDGDGLKDILTGKRFWAHGPDGDPETNAPAVLYWFRLVRARHGAVDFVPYLIDADSGVGTQIVVGDVNGDGLPDIVVANKKGTFVFLQQVSRSQQ